jgi:hypothetical protein
MSAPHPTTEVRGCKAAFPHANGPARQLSDTGAASYIDSTKGLEQTLSLVDDKQNKMERWIPVFLVILGSIAYVVSMFF